MGADNDDDNDEGETSSTTCDGNRDATSEDFVCVIVTIERRWMEFVAVPNLYVAVAGGWVVWPVCCCCGLVVLLLLLFVWLWKEFVDPVAAGDENELIVLALLLETRAATLTLPALLRILFAVSVIGFWNIALFVLIINRLQVQLISLPCSRGYVGT